MNVRFKDFRVGDIFLQERGKEKAPKQNKPGKTPLISETNQNNGLVGYVEPTKIFPGNCLTVSINYAETVFYQKDDFCASVNIAILRNPNITEKSGLYIASLLSKYNKRFDYNNKISKEKLNDAIISLPVKTSYAINFDLIKNLAGGGIDMSNIDTFAWKKFKLSELFDIKTTKAIDRKNVIFKPNGQCDFIGRTSVNYGVQGRVDYLDYAPNHANTFSLVQVGETCCLFREREWYASQNIFILIPKDESLCDIQLFLTTVINKQLTPYKEAYTYPTLKILQDLTILLPVKETEEIDFEYMEERIKELEEERIKELEEALRVMGLDDIKLTEEEEKVLISTPLTKKIKIGELFEMNSSKKKFNACNVKITTKGHPYVVRTSINNGIRGCINEDAKYLNDANTISLGQDTATMFYQEKPYFTGDKIKVLKLKCRELDEDCAQFFLTAMRKAFSDFSWGTSSFNEDIIKNVDVLLPVNKLGEIDFSYMRTYIKALQKLTIQKLYDDKGIFIEKAKTFINQQGQV